MANNNNIVDLRAADDPKHDCWAMFRPLRDSWDGEINIIEGGTRVTLSRAEFEQLANAYAAYRAKHLK